MRLNTHQQWWSAKGMGNAKRQAENVKSTKAKSGKCAFCACEWNENKQQSNVSIIHNGVYSNHNTQSYTKMFHSDAKTKKETNNGYIQRFEENNQCRRQRARHPKRKGNLHFFCGARARLTSTFKNGLELHFFMFVASQPYFVSLCRSNHVKSPYPGSQLMYIAPLCIYAYIVCTFGELYTHRAISFAFVYFMLSNWIFISLSFATQDTLY